MSDSSASEDPTKTMPSTAGEQGQIIPPFVSVPPGEFKKTDFCDKEGALRLARLIEGKWHALGYTGVKAWVVPIPFRKNGDDVFMVKSNLVNGMPS